MCVCFVLIVLANQFLFIIILFLIPDWFMHSFLATLRIRIHFFFCHIIKLFFNWLFKRPTRSRTKTTFTILYCETRRNILSVVSPFSKFRRWVIAITNSYREIVLFAAAQRQCENAEITFANLFDDYIPIVYLSVLFTYTMTGLFIFYIVYLTGTRFLPSEIKAYNTIVWATETYSHDYAQYEITLLLLLA